MCERCVEIDKTIAHYQWIKGRVIDPLTHQAADDLIEKLEAEKIALKSTITQAYQITNGQIWRVMRQKFRR